MRVRTFQEQVPFTLLTKSSLDWSGLDWVQGTIHSTPTVRRAASDASRLIVVTGGASEVSWLKKGREVRRKVGVGSITYMASGYELENLKVQGEQISMGLELNPARISAWTGEDVADGALSMQHLPPHVIDTDAHLLNLFSGILSEQKEGLRSGPLYAESLSLAIISYLWGKYSLRHRSRELNGLTPSKLAAVKDAMHAAIGDHVSLGELARVAGMTPRHFCRCFKHVSGVSPHRYLVTLRIEAAKQELRRRGATLTSIATTFGFSSLSHFSNVFRQFVGMSPSEFRKRQQP